MMHCPPPLSPKRGAAGGRPPAAGGRRPGLLRRAAEILLHEHSSPLEIGVGVALGAFVGMTPLYGFHLLLALALAALLRVNLAGAALGTQVSNPIFAPVVVLASVRLGSWLGFGSAAAASGWLASASGLLGAWAVGGLVMGALCGVVLGTLAGGIRALILRRRRAGSETRPA